MKKFFATEEALLEFANQLAKAIPGGCLIYLHGNLGAGKTTFARGFLRGLGYEGKVKSPTYTLIEPYDITGRKVYHCDFYRIKDKSELEELDIAEYFSPDAICLVEWPEKGESLLPPPDLVCSLTIKAEGREIEISACSVKGEQVSSVRK